MIKPMLAKSIGDVKTLPDCFYLQPKYNGIRAVWDGKELYSRRGKLIEGVPHIVDQLEKFFKNKPLDGEIYQHGLTLQEIVSFSRRNVNIKENSLNYVVYDSPLEKLPFHQRWNHTAELVSHGSVSKLHSVSMNKVWSNPTRNIHLSDIKYFDANIADMNIYKDLGYEGTMLRTVHGLYKFGKRSSDLLKIKEFQDGEFEIVGVTELTHKEKVIVPANTPGAYQYADGTWYKNGKETASGMMGSLVCITDDGKRFEVGTGFDDATRLEFYTRPPIGMVATVQYFEYTKDGIPFHPSFIALRNYE